jgi:hypothetical protein
MGSGLCQVTIRSDLEKPRRNNAIASALLVTVLAPLLALIPFGILAKGGMLEGFPLFVAYVFATVLIGSAELAGLRALFRWSIGKGEEGLDGLLKVVDTDARMKGDFRSTAMWPEPKLEPGSPEPGATGD